jgi:hypothetical protein
MRNMLVAMVAVAATFSFCDVMPSAMADEPGVVRKAKKARTVCKGPKCGPYAACGPRCRVACPDGYSCFPLYGAYGPYGGTGYWGGYTFVGWGLR